MAAATFIKFIIYLCERHSQTANNKYRDDSGASAATVHGMHLVLSSTS